MISIWGVGLWSKCWSFMGFFITREDLYLVSRFRVLRRYDFCNGFRVVMFEYFFFFSVWWAERRAVKVFVLLNVLVV